MPGPNRRSRRLKQATDLSSIGEFASVNPTDGDILIYDINDGVYENGRDLTGDYSIAGTLTATDLLVIDDVTIQDALVVQGNTNLEAALSVLGTSTFNDPVIAADTVDVTGATTLSSTLDVAGLLTGAGFLFNGTGQITGDLTVDGTLTADFDYSNMGDVTVNTLTANDWITVVNGVSAGTLSASNGLSVGGGASILGTLSAGELNVDDIYRVNFLPDEVNTPPEDDRIEITISEPETSLLFRVADTTSTFAVPVYNTAMEFQPDGAVDLYHDGLLVAQTATALTGGLFANNLSTGAGVERVLTTADLLSDHGDLTGLADDDHTQYVLADGSRDISASINTTGIVNTGALTSAAATAGADATAIGTSAGVTTQGTKAVAIGWYAGNSVQSSKAVAIGEQAGRYTQGADATALGPSAGRTSQGASATAVGYLAANDSQGVETVALGTRAAYTGQGNFSLAMGSYAGYNTQGIKSVSVGYLAGRYSQGTEAVAIGDSAGAGSATPGTEQGDYATALGYYAGNNTQGTSATALGREAGQTTQGNNAAAVGAYAGETSQGSEAIAIGYFAGNNTQGSNSVAVGPLAGQTTQATLSTAVGYAAGRTSQGTNATAIGNSAGITTQGAQAVAVGYAAGRTTQGNYSVAGGYLAGETSQGANGIIISSKGSAVDDTSAGHIHLTSSLASLEYTGGAWALKESTTSILTGDAAGSVDLYQNGTKVIESDFQGIKLLNANPALRLSDSAGTTQLSILQNFSGDLYLDNDVAGGVFNLRLDKADTTRASVITGDPDGAVVLYNAGSIAMLTTATGVSIRDTSGSVPILALQTDAGTSLAQFTHFSSAFRIAGNAHSDNVILTAENAAGTATNLILGDPDGSVSLYYAGAVALKTHATGFYVGTSTTVGSFIGSGTPESAVTAGIGSTFHRTDGGASTSFYVKESGAGNTGWVAK